MSAHYALTIKDNIITGIHEGDSPFTDELLAGIPEYAGHDILTLEGPGERTYHIGDDIRCYDEDGERHPNAWCIAQGYMEPPTPDLVRVMFQTLARTDVITPAQALENAAMFPVWADCIGQRAEAGSYWRHGGKLYRVNVGQGHTMQADWTPDQAASLFSLAANPADEWPKWIQPTGAHNAYAKDSKVTHGGKRWVSTADGNVRAPAEGVLWKQI